MLQTRLLALLLLPSAALAQNPFPVLDLAAIFPDDGVYLRVHGAQGTGSFGLPVAGGFDTDGDGFRDYAVAFFTANAFGRLFAGEVDLVFGDGTIGGIVDTALDDPDILRVVGAGRREVAGSEIWMDDVTGDGLGDLLICRQNHTPEPSRIGAGALTIVVGGPQLRAQAATLGIVDLLAPPPALTLTTILEASELDRLCIWARTGDVSGDGVADIVVGADQEDLGAETNRGAAWVIRGGAHLAAGGIIDLEDFGTTSLAGHLAKITPPAGATGYHLGATCQIADLDGNGRAEVLAAATMNRAGAAIEADGAPSGSAVPTGGAPEGTLYIAWDDNFPPPACGPPATASTSPSPPAAARSSTARASTSASARRSSAVSTTTATATPTCSSATWSATAPRAATARSRATATSSSTPPACGISNSISTLPHPDSPSAASWAPRPVPWGPTPPPMVTSTATAPTTWPSPPPTAIPRAGSSPASPTSSTAMRLAGRRRSTSPPAACRRRRASPRSRAPAAPLASTPATPWATAPPPATSTTTA